jgi:cytochrome P450
MDETTSKARTISLTAHILQDPLNPFPWYRIMRECYPIYYSSEFHSWFVSRYDDVQNVIDDTATFSSEKSIWSRPGADPSKSIKTLLWTDPPRHRQLRTLINQAFTPRTIANLAPRITQIVHSHLDAVEAQGTIDVIKDLANPLPIIVIAELLGVPIQDQRQFKQWSDRIVGTARKEKKQAVIERIVLQYVLYRHKQVWIPYQSRAATRVSTFRRGITKKHRI